MFADMPPSAPNFAYVSAVSTITAGQNRADRHWAISSDAAWEGSIELGHTRYPLIQPVTGVFSPKPNGFSLHMQKLSPTFVGSGKNPAEAELDLKGQIHIDFQRLYGKRPFQMTADERDKWQILSNAIDVPRYIRETPIEERMIGQIEWLKNSQHGMGPYVQIRRLGGEVELIPIEDVSRDMVALRPNDWFEAIIRRSSRSEKIQRVLFAQKIDPIGTLNDEEALKFWDEMPTTKSLLETNTAS
jgi:hypothetical protein